MQEKKRVMVQMRYSKELKNALTASRLSASAVSSIETPGFSVDESYTPVKIPNRTPREEVEDVEVGRLFTFDAKPEVATYLVRGEVESKAALDRLIETAKKDPDCVGVFADPKIVPFQVCPKDPVGNNEDVSRLLKTDKLREKGMDGSNVLVAIVDTGLNMDYLRGLGIRANLDVDNSWSPIEEGIFGPGRYPVDHGTMCAFDACIAAPECTLLDYALLRSSTPGISRIDGLLSDAVKGFTKLRDLLSGSGGDKSSLVVSNSWGMPNLSWDLPVGHTGNYSDNQEHPFNIVVESLADARADILFAAGNCGKKCPSISCKGATIRPIYGANSHESVLCVAGVTVKNKIVGYSSPGPGRLSKDKPDICAYTHFEGSHALIPEQDEKADTGTSAACPVAAGVIAAIRSVHSAADISPAQLRNIIRRNSDDLGKRGFDYKFGFGLINPMKIVDAISS